MTTLRKAAAQALDALTKIHPGNMSWETCVAWLNAVQILREALAQPEPEPVAIVVAAEYEDGSHAGHHLEWRGRNEANDYPEGTKLYTTPPQHQEANPVVWQFRMRPDWVLDKDFWEPWTNCTKEQAADYQRVPHLHDWKYEVRLLFTHPPQRKPLTDEELDALAIDENGLPNSHFEFARAIERAHGIGGEE